ncbi:hypothetical protein AB9P05_01045 [Roseivirga sp. BDSF3-8]|uniref:hypothetical protein n=1 Tax=Roseivirga sp. BDSF3-8 TaxID=3241598 RepID=UPI0035323D0A
MVVSHLSEHRFWEIVNDNKKFELMSYLLMAAVHPQLQWHKTPETRDGKRDGIAMSEGARFYFESKHFEENTKKLSHEMVGASINIAIVEMADVIWILTNGLIQNDLLRFIQSHNEIHNWILKSPLAVKTMNGRQFLHLFLSYPMKLYFEKLETISLTGYKSKTPLQLSNKVQEFQDKGAVILREIELLKKKETFLDRSPLTIKALLEDQVADVFKADILRNLIVANLTIAKNNFQVPHKSELIVGAGFEIQLHVQNYFSDSLNWKLEIIPQGLIQLGNGLKIDEGKRIYFLEAVTPASTERVVFIPAKIQRFPFKGLAWKLLVDNHEVYSSYLNLNARNPLFFAPFIGENNIINIGLFNEKIDRVFLEKRFFFALVSGRAGVGKTRFIEEAMNHTEHYPHMKLHINVIATEGELRIIEKMICFCLGLSEGSFVGLADRVLARFAKESEFSDIFQNKADFEAFMSWARKISSFGEKNIQTHELKIIASFLVKVLSAIGQKKMVVLIIEDLHLANRSLINFLNFLYNGLKAVRCKVAIISSARTEIKERNSAFIEFQYNVKSDPTYSIIDVEIEELSDNDATSLVNELIVLESKYHNSLVEQIREKTGNTPFNIIHTIVHLRNIGVIHEKNHRLEWHDVHKLEGVVLHHEVKKLLDARFDYYLKNTDIGHDLMVLMHIVSLLEASIYLDDLRTIANLKNFEQCLELAIDERLINVRGLKVFFSHENLFNYISENQSADAKIAAGRILSWLKNEPNVQDRHGIQVRCLNQVFPDEQEIFYPSLLSYFAKAQQADDWKKMERYGQLILDHRVDLIPGLELKSFSARYALWEIRSETYPLDEVIRSFDTLATEIKRHLLDHQITVSADGYLSFKMLEFNCKLKCSDVVIMASEYRDGQVRLNVLKKELQNIVANQEDANKDEANEMLIWTLNRLGVAQRGSGEILRGYKTMEQSLEMAKKSEHLYYIHHNYYDMAGCQLCMNDLDKAIELHENSYNKSVQIDLNAKSRTAIRYGILLTLKGKLDDAAAEFESGIAIARERNYSWELTRGLINLGNMYMLKGDQDLARKTYFTGLHFIDSHKAKALELCLHNNLSIQDLFEFQTGNNTNSLENALAYLEKVCDCLLFSGSIDVHRLSRYEQIAIINLFRMEQVESIKLNPQFKKMTGIQKTLSIFRPVLDQINYPEFYKLFEYKMGHDTFLLMFMSFS